MPFFLATPRKNAFVKQKNRVTGNTEYQRTAPSTLFIQVFSVISWVMSVIQGHLHHLSLAAAAFVESGGADPIIVMTRATPVHSYYQKISLTDQLPVEIPGLFLSFTEELSDTEVETLNGLGFLYVSTAGKSTGYCKLHPSADDIKFAMTLENLSTVDRAPQGYLRFDQVETFIQIRSSITQAAKLLTLAFAAISRNVRFIGYGFPEKEVEGNVLMPDKTYIMETKRKEAETDPDVRLGYSMAPVGVGGHGILVGEPLSKVHGLVSNAPTDKHGILIPYEPNYSSPDRGALNLFLSVFASISISNAEYLEEIMDRMNSSWMSSICSTPEGQVLAHIMVALYIAHKAAVGVFLIFTDGIYEGIILYSPRTFELKQFSVPLVRSLTGQALRDELASYSFRTVALGKVLVIAGIIAAQDPMESSLNFMSRLYTECAKFPSLRALQKKVLEYLKVGDGMKQDAIMKELQKVQFPQRPSSIHSTSILQALELMDPSSAAPISDSLFLSLAHFFSTDKVILALSMFGMQAPSPVSSGTAYSVVGEKSAKVIPTMPSRLRFKIKDTLSAAEDWRRFFVHGHFIQGNAGAHGKKTERSLFGDHAVSVWAGMGKVVVANRAFEKSKKPSVHTLIGEGKRKRDDDEDVAEGDTRRSKKPSIMQIFF